MMNSKYRFPFYKQLDAMDCGVACLRMIAKFHGKSVGAEYLREIMHCSRLGVSLLGIADAAEKIGFRTFAGKASGLQLHELNTPFIAHWRQNHWIVVYRVSKRKVYVADPAYGLLTYSIKEFSEGWKAQSHEPGIVMLLHPTPEFHQGSDDYASRPASVFLWSYFAPYKQYFFQLMLGAALAAVVGLLLPFLTQSLVDYGINGGVEEFVTMILFAQLLVFAGKMAVDFLRGRIILHIGARINISLVSDFLAKLMKLPIGWFENKTTGDVLQRITDNKRIETLLTSSSVSGAFSLFQIVLFGCFFAYLGSKIFMVFLLGTFLSLVWALLFLRKRKELDYKRFFKQGETQSALLQMLNGVKDIKLLNIERQKRWEWEKIQASVFHLSLQGLSLAQLQQAGFVTLNEVKNIVILFLSATMVMKGSATVGTMMATAYILGALQSPVEHLLGLLVSSQDAKISLERMNEIFSKEDEESPNAEYAEDLPDNKGISCKSVTFYYESRRLAPVLLNIDLDIPQHKTTAIVGRSGSGKTTLMKLLLLFYAPSSGDIVVGGKSLRSIRPSQWREACGAVMQDGYLFNDSILKNIAPTGEKPDKIRLEQAINAANLEEMLNYFPMGLQTKIGADGVGLSGGQKQRVLIARAVYKNPDYLFFDEATASLDAESEKTITENLQEYCKGKTVVVIAHRLSTVRNADNIVVLEGGACIEQGTHEQLLAKKGEYFSLVKNQLELG